MEKIAYKTHSQSAKRPESSLKPSPDESGGNLAELERLRTELRGRSDELRNTTVKETLPQKLPSSSEKEAEYTALINIDDRKTIYLGADKKEGTLVAAANPRGMEIAHKDERYGFSSVTPAISVTSVLPVERAEFTLSTNAVDNSKKRCLIGAASGDPVLESCSDGAVGNAVREIYSKKDEQTEGFIKEMSGTTPREDTALNNLSSLAGAIRQKRGAAQRSVEKETRRILNSITERGAAGDDFFDFLRRRHDEDSEIPVGDDNDTLTEGVIHEKDY